eukprot:scaffold84082_cov18-Tisochrysis_lutea.AAC.2
MATCGSGVEDHCWQVRMRNTPKPTGKFTFVTFPGAAPRVVDKKERHHDISKLPAFPSILSERHMCSILPHEAGHNGSKTTCQAKTKSMIKWVSSRLADAMWQQIVLLSY